MIDEKKLIEDIHAYFHKKINADKTEIIDNDIFTLNKDICEIVKEQPKVNEWIPCSERLPNCNGCYLVRRPHFFGGEIGMPTICYFDGQDTWHDSYGVDFTKILNKEDVLAWMPLPELCKGD